MILLRPHQPWEHEPAALLNHSREDRRILTMFSAIFRLTDDVNDQGFINFWSSCLGWLDSSPVLGLRDIADVDDELITIGWVNSHGKSHRRPRLVVRGPEYLENPNSAV